MASDHSPEHSATSYYGFSSKRVEQLIRHGFIKEDKRDSYSFNKEKQMFEPKQGHKLKDSDADMEERETTIFGDYLQTGYPTPLKSYRLWWEVHDLSIEEPYFWTIDNLREHVPILEKLEDSFAASENSAFFGVTQQRLGAQQDKVSQFLATTGKMIKELFQMVRELRIIKERLSYYDEVEQELKKEIKDRRKSGEITLKGLFVDLVQGGGKSAASVYGMSRELEFITLPDLFFDAPPFRDKGEMEKWVDGLAKDFNNNVIRVLKRHLDSYMTWKKTTHQEHHNRNRFMLHYLRQHFDIIRMYIDWIKPYLRHVNRLKLKDKNTFDIISSFEGSLLDIEVLARTPVGPANACTLLTFNYRTRPELKVVQEGYQRGPVHVGRIEINFRVYSWSNQEVEMYKKLKQQEAMDLMGEVSTSVEKAMEGLGGELDKYLREADALLEEHKTKGDHNESHGEQRHSEHSTSSHTDHPKDEHRKTLMQKFLGDFYTPSHSEAKVDHKKERAEEEKLKKAKEKAEATAKKTTWNIYKNFKKAHKMIMW